MLRPTSRAQWPTTTGSNGKHPGYRAGSVSILLLLVVAELSATSRGPVEQGRRRQRSHHRYAGEPDNIMSRRRQNASRTTKFYRNGFHGFLVCIHAVRHKYGAIISECVEMENQTCAVNCDFM